MPDTREKKRVPHRTRCLTSDSRLGSTTGCLEKYLCIFPSPSGSNSGFCYKILDNQTQAIQVDSEEDPVDEDKADEVEESIG